MQQPADSCRPILIVNEEDCGTVYLVEPNDPLTITLARCYCCGRCFRGYAVAAYREGRSDRWVEK